MVRVKVCGLTNADDAVTAARAGADMVGFIFHPASRRYVTPTTVRAIMNVVRPEWPEIVAVGVFVNETAANVARVLDYCGLDAAQLHGDELPTVVGLDPKQPSALAGRAFRALRPRTLAEAIQLATEFALPSSLHGARLPALLIDTFDPTCPGGTGQVGDWAVAAHLAARHSVLLAGGLTPDNVAEAVRCVRPWGVDVAGGVEAVPGKKDHTRIWAFVAAAKAAE